MEVGGFVFNILGGMVCVFDFLELDLFLYLILVFNLNRGKIVEKILVWCLFFDVLKWVLFCIG